MELTLENSPAQPKIKTGMYLLETLTAGMYNEPLAIYREYIQNSADSIDLMAKKDKDFRVNIDLEPMKRRITISDNGYGISSEISESILCSLGDSNKINKNLRGFRGIGRLGGIAFSDKATFQTKADGEKIESVQEWDCKGLREYLNTPQKKLSLTEIVKKITNYKQTNNKKASGSYFKVTLDGVKSFRNYIFDINKVKNYLSQIAPVPFDLNNFSYGQEIDEWLPKQLRTYGSYNIFLNNNPIFKPYRDTVKINKSAGDYIESIKKFEIIIKDKKAAYGWIGLRKKMIGAITRGEGTSGIRVRVGNILIGDSHLLDGCFREDRFNSYIIGEIHVDCPQLIPNSRRDDFIDNDYKTLFYNAIEREIGFSLSKEIRQKSRIFSTQKAKNSTKKISISKGVNLKPRQDNNFSYNSNSTKQKIEEIVTMIKISYEDCQTRSKILDKLKHLHEAM